MGAVYLVKHERLGKTFALKETFFTDDELLRRAFEREAQLLANLDHPALPKVTDHFMEFENQFLLMEYIPGEDLGTQLRTRAGPFALDEVLEWADQLLDALEYLHTHDPPIIHRDIKPANLKVNARNKIILLDFGLAKGSTSEMSPAGRSLFGFTPNYAPPEQVHGEGTDARSDLFSLAATVYHLLTAVMPPSVTARVAAIADGHPDPLRLASELSHSVNRDIALVLMKAMARNRDARHSNAAEMRKALREETGPPALSIVELGRALAPTVLVPLKRNDGASTVPSPDERKDRPPLEVNVSREREEKPQRRAREELEGPIRAEAELAGRAQAELDARARTELEAHIRAEIEAKIREEEGERDKAEEARRLAEEETRRRTKEEARQLERGNMRERAEALAELGRIGGEEAFHHISAAFDDQSVDIRSAAARAMFDLQEDQAAAFTRALREGTPERRRMIGSAIASSGLASEAIRKLTGETRDKTYEAFSILFLMSKAGETRPLMEAIEDHPNIEVQLAVVKLLALSGQPDILPAFRRMAVRGSLPPEVRSAVMEAIYQISTQTSKADPSDD
jgi:serine/threonine protein kinase